MKRWIVISMVMAAAVVFSAAAASAQETVPMERPFSPADIPGNILRGALNVLTCPVEIFRSCSYEASMDRSGTYIFTGPVYGIGYMVGRAFLGAVDICTLGLTGNKLYTSEFFPEYVWVAPWSVAHEEPPED